LPEDAMIYSLIIEKVLGPQWLDPSLFRLGASKLANNLLRVINKIEKGDAEFKDYF
jgi:hypothetical protein